MERNTKICMVKTNHNKLYTKHGIIMPNTKRIAELTMSEILGCILSGVQVSEKLNDGRYVILNENNYNKDLNPTPAPVVTKEQPTTPIDEYEPITTPDTETVIEEKEPEIVENEETKEETESPVVEEIQTKYTPKKKRK